MNKTLAIVLVVLIALSTIGGGAFYLFKKTTAPVAEDQTDFDDEAGVAELPLDQKPYVSLTPSADGHNLHLVVNKIPSNVAIVEYDLRYTNAQGVQQGVTSEGRLSGATNLERDLLMGSCSSGKCKYDEGVEDGTLAIKLRDGKRKLVAKTMEAPFHLMKNPTEVTLSGQTTLSLKLDKPNTSSTKSEFYLAMSTIGVPQGLPGTFQAGPIGVFTSAKTAAGVVTLGGNGDTYLYDETSWTKLPSTNKTSKVGIFAKAS